MVRVLVPRLEKQVDDGPEWRAAGGGGGHAWGGVSDALTVGNGGGGAVKALPTHISGL